MTTKTYDALSKDLLLMAHNPSAMQSLMLNQLQDVQDADGQILLRDPTDPVVYMTEVGITMGHTIIQGDRDTIPKMFPLWHKLTMICSATCLTWIMSMFCPAITSDLTAASRCRLSISEGDAVKRGRYS